MERCLGLCTLVDKRRHSESEMISLHFLPVGLLRMCRPVVHELDWLASRKRETEPLLWKASCKGWAHSAPLYPHESQGSPWAWTPCVPSRGHDPQSPGRKPCRCDLGQPRWGLKPAWQGQESVCLCHGLPSCSKLLHVSCCR